jgi:hypothetical protein
MPQVVVQATVMTCVRNGYTTTPSGYAVGGPGPSPSYNNSTYFTFPAFGIPGGATITAATLSWTMTSWDWAAAVTMNFACATGAGTPTNQYPIQGTPSTTSVPYGTYVSTYNALSAVTEMYTSGLYWAKMYCANGENRKNYSSTKPTLTITYTESRTDAGETVGISDGVGISISAVMAEDIGLSDELIINPGQLQIDTVSIGDALSASVSTQLSDSMAVSDSVSESLAVGIAEAFGVTEGFFIAQHTQLTDDIPTGESFEGSKAAEALESVALDDRITVTRKSVYPSDKVLVWNADGEFLGMFVAECSWVDNLDAADELEVQLPQYFVDERGQSWSKWELIQGEFLLGWRGKRYRIDARSRSFDGQHCRATSLEVELGSYYTNETPTTVVFENELVSDIVTALLDGKVSLAVPNSAFSTRVTNPIDQTDEPARWTCDIGDWDGYESPELDRFVWKVTTAHSRGYSEFIRFSPNVDYVVRVHLYVTAAGSYSFDIGTEFLSLGESPGTSSTTWHDFHFTLTEAGDVWLETVPVSPEMSELGDLYLHLYSGLEMPHPIYALDVRLYEQRRPTGWTYSQPDNAIDVRDGVVYADHSEWMSSGTWELDYVERTRTSTSAYDTLVYAFNSPWVTAHWKASGVAGSKLAIFLNGVKQTAGGDINGNYACDVDGSLTIVGIDPTVDQFLDIRVVQGTVKVWKVELDTRNVFSFAFQGDSVLTALSTILQATGGVLIFDSSARTVQHYKTYGVDYSEASLGMMFEDGKNVIATEVTEDTSNLINRLKVNGYGEGPYQLVTFVEPTLRKRLGPFVTNSPTPDGVTLTSSIYESENHVLWNDNTYDPWSSGLIDLDAFYPGDRVTYTFAYQFDQAAVDDEARVKLFVVYVTDIGSTVWGYPYLVSGGGGGPSLTPGFPSPLSVMGIGIPGTGGLGYWLPYAEISVDAVDTDKHLFSADLVFPAGVIHGVSCHVSLDSGSGQVVVESLTATSQLYRAWVTSQERYGVKTGALDIPEIDSLPTARKIGVRAADISSWPAMSFSLQVKDLEEYGDFKPGDYVPLKVWGEYYVLRIISIAKSTISPNVADITVSSRETTVFSDIANMERKIEVLSRSFQGVPTAENIPFFTVPFERTGVSEETPASIPFYIENGAQVLDLRVRYQTKGLVSTAKAVASGGAGTIAGSGLTAAATTAVNQNYAQQNLTMNSWTMTASGGANTGGASAGYTPTGGQALVTLETIPQFNVVEIANLAKTTTSLSSFNYPAIGTYTRQVVWMSISNRDSVSRSYTVVINGTTQTPTVAATSSLSVSQVITAGAAITASIQAGVAHSFDTGIWAVCDMAVGHTHTVNSHTHTIPDHTHFAPDHIHSISGHTHLLAAHTHVQNSHQHDISHTHAALAHVHTLTLGLTEGAEPTALQCLLDDVNVTSLLDCDDLDLLPFVKRDNNGRPQAGWHELVFSATTVGESGSVSGTIFIRKFLTTAEVR